MMNKTTFKLAVLVLVALFAFALTSCFAPTTTTITFINEPKSIYEVNSSEKDALSEIVVTIADVGFEKTGTVWDFQQANIIIVEGFNLSTEGERTARIIFGESVLKFKYVVTSTAILVGDTDELVSAFSKEGITKVKLNASFTVTKLVHITQGYVVLDLNGKTLTSNVEGTTERLINVDAGAKLEIIGEGKIVNDMLHLRGLLDVDGELVIHSGEFIDRGVNRYKDDTHTSTTTAPNGALLDIASAASVTIYGGTFRVEKNPTSDEKWGRAAIYNYGLLKMYGGEIYHSTPSVTVGAYAIISEGELFINNATVNANRGPIAVTGGTFYISGGKFIAKNTHVLLITSEINPVSGTISGGTFINESNKQVVYIGSMIDDVASITTSMIITGGAFQGVDGTNIIVQKPSINVSLRGGDYYKPNFNENAKDAISPIYQLTEQNEEGWVSIVKNSNPSIIPPVESLSVEAKTEDDLRTAFASNEDTLTVIVKNDIVLSAPVEVTAKHIVLDINGKTISTGFDNSDTRAITVAEGAKLEIKGNGTMLNEAGMVAGLIKVYGEVVIHNGNFVDYGWNMPSHASDTWWSNGSMINVEGLLTIYNGTFNNKKHANATVYDTGIQYGRYIIYTRELGTTQIYGGTFYHEADEARGSYALSSEGTFFMSGGEVTSERGALAATGGTLEVSGGKFVSKKHYAIYLSGIVSGVVTGGSFINESNSNVMLVYSNTSSEINTVVSLAVSGGTFKGVGKTMIIVDGSASTVNFSGGKYYMLTFNPTGQNFIKEGYRLIEQDDIGWFSIVKV